MIFVILRNIIRYIIFSRGIIVIMMPSIMWCHLLKEDECSKRSQIALAAKKYIMPGSILSKTNFKIQFTHSTLKIKTVTWKMITISLGLLTSTPSCIFSYFHSFLCARIRSYIVSVPCDHQNRRKLGMITKEKKWLMRYCSDYQVKSYFSINLVSYL